MLKYGEQYVDKGMQYYEEKYRAQEILSIQKKAQQLGFDHPQSCRIMGVSKESQEHQEEVRL
jgi:hypothetical protein